MQYNFSTNEKDFSQNPNLFHGRGGHCLSMGSTAVCCTTTRVNLKINYQSLFLSEGNALKWMKHLSLQICVMALPSKKGEAAPPILHPPVTMINSCYQKHYYWKYKITTNTLTAHKEIESNLYFFPFSLIWNSKCWTFKHYTVREKK